MTAKKKWILLGALAIVIAAVAYFLAFSGARTVPGFHFTVKDGVVAVRADRLAIPGGVFARPVLENAYIDAFGAGRAAGDLNLGGAFSRDAFASFPGGSSVIEARPAALKIYNGKDVVAQIFASRLEIDLGRQRLTFQGTARILSGNTLLIAERLTFSPEKMSVEAERFALQKPDKRVEGQTLKTNVLLETATAAKEKKG